MTVYTREQIAAYAKGAGFTGNNVNIAVAVALAESGGNNLAHNNRPPDDSYGLWQINMLGALGPSRRKDLGISSNADLFDPRTNARAAYMIYKRSGWNAWTTYTGGQFKRHIATGSDAGTAIPAPTTEDDGSANPIIGVSAAVNAFSNNLFKTGANIGGIAVALVFLVLGFVILARSQVAGLIPAGKVAKIAKKVAS